MTKTIRYIFQAAVLAILSSCAGEQLPEPVPSPDETEHTVTITGSVNIGEMAVTQSRAFGDTPGAGLTISALEFTLDNSYQNRTLVDVIPAEIVNTTAAANGEPVQFKITLKKSAEPRVLHFVVSDGPIDVSYGTVAAVLQKLSVSGDRDAYWGRVEFEQGYCDREFAADGTPTYTPRPELTTKLTNIPLIRNFAKISVNSNLPNFALEGFELVNIPTAGTVAPWNPTTQAVPYILQENDWTKMKPYSELKDIYSGILSPEATFSHLETEAATWAPSAAWSTEPKFMYEHPYEAARRTFMIVAGRFGGSATTTYYKIDLGANDTNTQIFTPYNIIRNYHYVVTINSVARAGYATVQEAIDGTVFNNLSASTETRDMLSLSDGQDMIGVNFTRAVVVNEDQELVFKYCYTRDVNVNKGQVDNGLAQLIGCDPGEVIKSVRTVEDGDTVYVYITPNPPTDITKTQVFTVVGRNGLGRTITLIDRLPWKLNDIEVFAGSLNKRPTLGDAGVTDIIGTGSGDPLTIYFNLPNGLPESIFPLQFTLEADRQNIENNTDANSTLVVTSGQSLFENAGQTSVISKPAIQYIKTITYQEYEFFTNDDNKIQFDDPNTNHAVRCRFRTTLSFAEIGNPPHTLTHVKIYNPYFKEAETEFYRGAKP